MSTKGLTEYGESKTKRFSTHPSDTHLQMVVFYTSLLTLGNLQHNSTLLQPSKGVLKTKQMAPSPFLVTCWILGARAEE